MELLYARCAGLDVHSANVATCARIATGGTVTYHHRTVSTTTKGLLELAEWLSTHECTHVVMMSFSSYLVSLTTMQITVSRAGTS
jgi:transposase